MGPFSAVAASAMLSRAEEQWMRGFVSRNPTVVLFLLWFLYHSALFAQTPPVSSGTLVFSYLAGRATNSIQLHPVGKQSFAPVTVNGVPCISLTPNKSEDNRTWYFVLAARPWKSLCVDADLVVEQIASETELRWLVYDAGFHEYHQFPDPPFGFERAMDRTLFQTPTQRTELPGNLIRSVYRLRKATFSRRSDFDCDFHLHADKKQFTGLHRILLLVHPVPDAVPDPVQSQPVTLSRLLDQFFRDFLQRPITAWELKRYEEAYAKKEIWLFPFLQRMLYHPEFQERIYFGQERVEAVRSLFRMACRREPLRSELNAFAAILGNTNMDFSARVFIERYYSEIVEQAVINLRKVQR